MTSIQALTHSNGMIVIISVLFTVFKVQFSVYLVLLCLYSLFCLYPYVAVLS